MKTAQDLRDKELILGDTGPGTGTRSYPKVLNDLLGYKFKLVSGFRSSADVFLAMERGEVDGICESLDSIHNRRPDWIPKKKVTVLLQGGVAPHPEPAGRAVRARSRAQRRGAAVARIPLRGAGHRPAVRGAARPDARPAEDAARRFSATMKDAEFLADAKKSKLEVEPEDGEHLAALIAKIYATPKPIIERVGNLIK